MRKRGRNPYWFVSELWLLFDIRKTGFDSRPFLEVLQPCRVTLEFPFEDILDIPSPSGEEGFSFVAASLRFFFDTVQYLLEYLSTSVRV